jgi:hypothetical protein
MSRIRSIKPDFWCSEQVISLSRDARLLFIGMWNFADDAGRIKLNPVALKAQVFPGDDDMTRDRVVSLVAELIRGELVECYANGHGVFGEVTGWKRHQKIDKPTPSKYPGPNDKDSIRRTFDEYSTSARGVLATEGSEREIGEERSDPRARAHEPEPESGERPLPESAPLPPEPAEAWTAETQRLAFIQAYEARMRTTPGMGGKQVALFHHAVMRTAELQRRDPRELFTETLQRWLSRPHTDVERRSPYACFFQAWSDLTAASAAKSANDRRSQRAAPAEAFRPTDIDELFGSKSKTRGES